MLYILRLSYALLKGVEYKERRGVMTRAPRGVSPSERRSLKTTVHKEVMVGVHDTSRQPSYPRTNTSVGVWNIGNFATLLFNVLKPWGRSQNGGFLYDRPPMERENCR